MTQKESLYEREAGMVPLAWMERLRTRHREQKFEITPEERKIIDVFLKPILEYGLSEERRITKCFDLKEEVKRYNNEH